MIIEQLIDYSMLAVLVMIAVAIVRTSSMVSIVMLAGIYSLHSALIFVALDAVDVAFTEAAVGAGISTVLFMATLRLTGHKARARPRKSVIPLFVVALTGAALIYGTADMPLFGDPNNPVHQHVAPRYIEESPKETGVPNMVTSVLASYRGFDTLGEVTVIFTAGVGVMLLLSRRKRPTEEIEQSKEES